MVRTAVASRPAVMLVGPPGTGKSQLINELLSDIAKDPAIVGMSEAYEALTVTPDEAGCGACQPRAKRRALIVGRLGDQRGRHL